MKLLERLACLMAVALGIHINQMVLDQSLVLTLLLKIRHTELGQSNRQHCNALYVLSFNAQ